jgi:hypothetical protein
MKLTKYLAAAAAVCIAGGLAWGGGLWQTLPIIGGAAYCSGSNIVGPAQQTITGQSGTPAAANATTGNVICTVTEPAGPPALTGTEVVPVDLYTPGSAVSAGGAASAVLPVTLLGPGVGGTTIDTTTGTQTPAMSNGIQNFIYAGAGAATFTTFTLPPNPMQNQFACLRNAGSGAITLTTVQVAANSGQSIVQGAQLGTVAVQTTATAAESATCYLYNVSNTTWYRVL